MPIIHCGMACQFNTGKLVPLDQIEPYVQDALDLIEFANGPADSEWGRVRAAMGHPEPFNLKMIGIGNEQWGPQYIERYLIFEKAIRERYPEIQLIAATGSDATIFPDGEAEVAWLWEQWREIRPDFVDEHYYRRPEWSLENTDWYDDYDRNDPPVFVGEYAAQSVGVASPENRNNLKCALYEAAFMTGMERNADVVRMTCYAPLFGHELAWQWRPDLIWFDTLNTCATVNYHVQKLFSLNRGTHMLRAELADAPRNGAGQQTLHASAVLDAEAGEVVLKIVNVAGEAQTATIDLQGARPSGAEMKVTVLAGESLDDENTIAEPTKIVPRETTETVASMRFDYECEPYSLTVLRIPVR